MMRETNEKPDRARFQLVDSSLIVRVHRASGMDGAHFFVFIEEFMTRDHVSRASKRYMLTNREREVIQLLIKGARTGEIAEELSIALSTATLHIKSVMSKTGARTRTEMLGLIMTGETDRPEG